jgi:ribosomal protein L12E/L44/L45/RPP1/RPP2
VKQQRGVRIGGELDALLAGVVGEEVKAVLSAAASGMRTPACAASSNQAANCAKGSARASCSRSGLP